MKYYAKYIGVLKDELRDRFDKLLCVISFGHNLDPKDYVTIDIFKLRLAIEDLQAILKEVKKLK